MLRFIDLDRQINPGNEESPPRFAIYNTINDRFLDVGGNQVWETYAKFKDDITDAQQDQDFPHDVLKRVYGLCPDWAKGGVEC